jgi:UDPglucose 6-dehydrogenase
MSTIMTKIRHAVGGSLAGRRVAVWGLTFKARTDDRRDSPAVEIVGRMVAEGARVQAFDPTVDSAVPELSHGVDICADAYAACDGAAAVVVLTEWEELRWLDFTKVRGLMAEPSVVDARNLLDPSALRRMGFAYVGVGRP